MTRLRLVLAALLLALPVAAGAVLPDEILADPALEARARALGRELRCVVCQAETIDESNADIARDLRLLVRERLVAGDTDAEIKAFLVARYGEFILFRPPFTLANAPLWLSAPAFLLLGLGGALLFIRRRSRMAAPPREPLDPREQERLAQLLSDRA